ncbi:cold shock and DUF1294 domain-containing protein [Paraglaciecola aquimarina]|uniref:Cold shock and DUF1294 domain-containing protein n=1 Tax=Paraglaciecola aquimarina TaxID=1235557 RepID=A0ABU3SW42_9ALTE|nr:cold shock and DUF1294 domain-containing protein [Paraglaciecola aquimarina]MDU0354238.1 cold shock and DUF1294 domain-containing protein [Paraglaciecola aquimarina]
MRKQGKLIKWNAAKAFGFIQLTDQKKQIFVHKKAFCNRTRTPQLNDIITFSMATGSDGRLCAKDATFLGEKVSHARGNGGGVFSMYLALLFYVVISLACLAGLYPRALLFTFLGASILTFFVYALDKSKARRGAWRISESTLHFLALLGGWPGAACAQQILRHKSQKRTFRKVFWGTVVINIASLMWLYSSSGSHHLSWLLSV